MSRKKSEGQAKQIMQERGCVGGKQKKKLKVENNDQRRIRGSCDAQAFCIVLLLDPLVGQCVETT